MTLISFLTITIAFLLLVIAIMGYKLYQFSIVIIDLEDGIEECLDILNERYKSMFDIIQKPIFFDSVEIRQVINDIKKSHQAILKIAHLLTKNTGEIIDAEFEEEDS